MPPARSRVLYVTDLAYPARGRRYCDEDILLTSRLRDDFDVALCHPRHAAALMAAFDVVVVRNSGPVLAYQDVYDDFRRRAIAGGTRVYNPLSGKADMAGKQYLLDLTAAGHPVIPTVDRAEDLHLLPDTERYVVKPKLGADSIGLRIVSAEGVRELVDGDVLVQPRVDFTYEVSFYFVDHDFQYALYAPHTDRRWQLEPYEPTDGDVEFARGFIEWNGLGHGIQRVDACRAPGGELLLVELEDLNPYLSLDALDDTRRDAFVAAMKESLRRFLATGA
ncbi:hypothetical protein ACM01_00325 [Streptomyces viridochromogenes]|uniref:ATP-grasp domain-containing protein n=1 Tax=Streptomyces viridochromogenes TaxID=1938 RepID=A0A0J7ZM73_STRVR|nr:hypothetical protein [Streptomyces viridochromogenes]KMS77126.1 hypothetical protein ACM01_00325 [Streptomyces viridochromogenes]KOG09369.1 hypothetical protein ADK35_40070 [Streptomyces viridochromogenes]KOG27276.1 hypothetical protein ADK36_01635 [Streptomyces viridochromogenes]